MAITFPRVDEVAVGDPVSSRNLAQLSDAINARLKSGLGDGAYRVVQHYLNAFRQIRNPDALGNFPSQAEFFTTYQQLGPDFEWPDASPGDNEGVNVSSLVGSYVFGNSVGKVEDEKTRLIIDGVPVSVANTPAAAWQLAKDQRGAYDPNTRGVASPSFTAAMSYAALTQGGYGAAGKSYGGFFPIPDSAGSCADGSESLTLKWSNIATGSARTFAGTCPENSGDVAAVYAMPLGWYVVTNSGATTYLPRNEWIEGPYTRGEHPRHTWGNHLPRAFAQFASEFRGSKSQKEDEEANRAKWLGNAFNVAQFLTRPYYLSPSIGTEITSGLVVPTYPTGIVNGGTNLPADAGTLFINGMATAQTAYIYTASGSSLLWSASVPSGGSVMSPGTLGLLGSAGNVWRIFGTFNGLYSGAGTYAALALDSGGAGSDVTSSHPRSTAGMLPDGTRIGGSLATHEGFGVAAVYVEATNISGSATIEFRNGTRVFATATVSSTSPSAIVTLADYEEGTDISARTSGSVSFTRSGTLRVEFAHLQKYKPQFMDLFLVLRLSGAKLKDSQDTDGCGLAEDKAAALWEAYRASGCITLAGDHGELEASTSLGENAVFDTLRRMSKCVRMIPRNNLLGYALEAGNSVVWVTPRAFATPGVANANLLEGIVDEIATTAPAKGYSNEWVGFANAHPYHTSESSNWKASAFSDYFPLIDRCGYYQPSIAGTNSFELRRFVTYGAIYGGDSKDLLLAPEYASGYRYAKRTNHSAIHRPSFYKSCRLYEPPLAVKKAESQTDGSVKITFDGRFHHHETAPSTIARDAGTWDVPALTTEASDYRTEENAIREYLVHSRGSGSYQCDRLGEGNSEADRAIDGEADRPFGSCYPTIFLVQQIPKPYADGNDAQNPTDTPFDSYPLRLAETYLRIMCEGYVDGVTSAASGCDVGATFEFTWDKCCYHATGLPWLQMIGDTAGKYLPATEIRTDHPEGFGPMPTTMASASVFNGFAKVANSLTRVRVTLPWDLEVDDAATGNSTTPVGGFRRSDGGALDCSTYAGGGLFWQGGQPDAPAGAFAGTWYSAGYAVASIDTVVAYSGSSYSCSGSSFALASQRKDQRYRIHLTDPDALNAIPEAWRGMVATDTEFVAVQVTTRRRVSWIDVAAGSGESCGASAGWQDGAGGEYAVTFNDVPETECGKFRQSDTLHAPTQASINLAASKNGLSLCDAGATFSSGVVSRTLTPVDPEAFVLAITLGEPTVGN